LTPLDSSCCARSATKRIEETKDKLLLCSTNKQVCDLSLEVAQNSHDVSILLALKQFFKGGYIKPKYNVNKYLECLNSRSVNRFVLRSPLEILIKFLSENPLKTRRL